MSNNEIPLGSEGDPGQYRDPRFVFDVHSNDPQAMQKYLAAQEVAQRMHAPEVVRAVAQATIAQKQQDLDRFMQTPRRETYAAQLNVLYGYWEDGLTAQTEAMGTVKQLARNLSNLRSEAIHDMVLDLGDAQQRQKAAERTLRVNNTLLGIVEPLADPASELVFGLEESVEVEPQALSLARKYNLHLATIASAVGAQQAQAAARLAFAAQATVAPAHVHATGTELNAENALVYGLLAAYSIEAKQAASIHLQLNQFAYVRLVEAMQDVEQNADKTAYWQAQDHEIAHIFGIEL